MMRQTLIEGLPGLGLALSEEQIRQLALRKTQRALFINAFIGDAFPFDVDAGDSFKLFECGVVVEGFIHGVGLKNAPCREGVGCFFCDCRTGEERAKTEEHGEKFLHWVYLL